MSRRTWRLSRLWACALMPVALGSFAIGGGKQSLAEMPTPNASPRATADNAKPPGAAVEADKDRPIELKIDSVIAKIGDSEQILLSDVIADVNEQFAQVSRTVSREQREMWLKSRLEIQVRQLIPIKALLAEVRREVLKENLDQVWKQVEDIFDRQFLPYLLEERKLETAAALDAQLKSAGGSLAKRKQQFVELAIAQQYLYDHAKFDEEVAPDELHDYYQAHYEQYDIKAKVRWEQLQVKFIGRTKPEARQLLAEMREQLRAGTAWEAAAQARSEGPTAAGGGKRDWTSQSSLKFAALDQALFALPVGAISEVLENEDGVQIVRVVERTPARVIPLEEKQREIKKAIVDQRSKQAEAEFLQKLLEQYKPRTWTVFDDGRALTIPSLPES